MLPILILNFSAVDTVTKVAFGNTTTDEEIEITETIVANDIGRFDCEAKTVTVNGVNVEYAGKFITLEYGANAITVTVH